MTQIMIEVSKVEEGLVVNVISNHAVDPIAALGIVEVAKQVVISNHAVDPIAALGIVEVAKQVIFNGGMKVAESADTENVEQ